MKLTPLRILLLALLLGNGLFAAETATSQTEAKAATPEQIKARLAQHAREKAEESHPKSNAVKPVATKPAKDQSSDEPAMLMPEYKVNATQISELDIEIKKLEKKIEREKKKLKPSELDEKLNGDKTPKALLIFGGKTAAQRQSVAADRVTFLEAERDILEAMKHVRTKKEHDDLETQLNAFKTMSRELDETLR